MIAFGRAVSTLVLLAVLALTFVVTVRPDLEHVGSVHTLDWIAMTLYLSAGVAWLSAVLHWALRFPREGERARWGLVAVLGFVPGAMAYWWWGARRARR